MKRLNQKLALSMGLAVMMGSAFAQSIGVVDMMKVNYELQLEQKMRSQVDKQFADRIADFQDLRSKFEKKKSSFERDKALWDANKQREAQRDLESKQAQIQLSGKALEQDMKEALLKSRDELLGKMQLRIDKIRQDKSFDLILQKGATIASSQSIDISELVIKSIKDQPLMLSSSSKKNKELTKK